MKKQEVINLINEAQESLNSHFPSIYHRNDVMVMLQNIKQAIGHMDDDPQPLESIFERDMALVAFVKDQMSCAVTSRVERIDWSECCEADLDSAEFDISGNELSCTHIDVDTHEVYEQVEECISDAFNNDGLSDERLVEKFKEVEKERGTDVERPSTY